MNFISPPTKKKKTAQAETVEIVEVQSDKVNVVINPFFDTELIRRKSVS